MDLIERFREKSSIMVSSGALAVLLSSGCATPEGTFALGGIAGGNALYNSSLSPQAAAGLGLASALLQSGAVLQQGKQTQQMINQPQSSNDSNVSANTSAEVYASDPFMKVLRLPDVGRVAILYYEHTIDKNGDGADYPEEYVGLRPANNARFPQGKPFRIGYSFEDKSFQKFFVKILDAEGNIKLDTMIESSEPEDDIEVEVKKLQFSGKYSLVVYGKEKDNRATLIINQPKPWFSFGKSAVTYSPPPKPEPRVLFLGEAPFEVYESK
ncbi:hypothetical protein FJZ18_02400 [Candidatus Pacearchaeota archaeon]|nr:hypothetical protein [Candidatus Pacearchaeota archaeon]